MPLLLVLPDGRHVPLEKPVVSVGSDSACDVVLREPGVKPSHALLFQDARGWTVSAAARGCEVRVRNKRVELAPIAPGESFSVGRVSLTLLSSEALPPATGSVPEAAPTGRLLAVLTGFASRLMVQRPTVELLDVAMRGLAEVADADVGFLVSVEGPRRQVLCSTGPVPEAAVVDSLVNQVVASGTPVLVADVASDAALAGAPSVVALRLSSALVLPLRGGTAPLCVVYLGRRGGRPPFSPRELEDGRGHGPVLARPCVSPSRRSSAWPRANRCREKSPCACARLR
jgi:hypothetical protein